MMKNCAILQAPDAWKLIMSRLDFKSLMALRATCKHTRAETETVVSGVEHFTGETRKDALESAISGLAPVPSILRFVREVCPSDWQPQPHVLAGLKIPASFKTAAELRQYLRNKVLPMSIWSGGGSQYTGRVGRNYHYRSRYSQYDSDNYVMGECLCRGDIVWKAAPGSDQTWAECRELVVLAWRLM